MDKKAITKALRDLANDNEARSKAAQFRDLMPDIEAALAAGVSQSKVLETLNKNGLELTANTFRTFLRRARLKTATGKNARSAATPTPRLENSQDSTTETGEPDTTPDAALKSHDPQVINNILSSTPDLNSLAKASTRGKRS